MPDDVDDLILKMQHLEAAARESQTAHGKQGRFAALKSKAQQMAVAAQVEIDAAEKEQAEGAAREAKARTPGTPPLEAGELLASGRALASEAKTRLVKAKARLNFALDQMDEADRSDYQALQAEARAEAHTQLAESGDDSSRMPELKAPAPAPAEAASAVVAPLPPRGPGSGGAPDGG